MYILCIYTYMHVCIYYMSTHLLILTYIYISIYVHVYMYICTYIHRFLYIDFCVYMYIYIYICMHIANRTGLSEVAKARTELEKFNSRETREQVIDLVLVIPRGFCSS